MKNPSLYASPKLGNMNDWQGRHNQAIDERLVSWPSNPRRKAEAAILRALAAWERYADAHRATCDSPIGEDYVLGQHWKEWGLSLRGLLNGDVGPRLDCGTLDAFILDTLAVNGIDTSNL